MRTAAWVALTALTALVSGCGSGGSSADPTSGAQTSAPSAPIVGRWEQVHTCGQLVAALTQAELAPVAPAMVGDFFPGTSVEQLSRKHDLCSGATPQRHSHFFTQSGMFGSLDQNDNQVDESAYQVADDHTLRIGSAEFRYQIADDALTLQPVISPTDRTAALADPTSFSTAGWQVAVAYPGLPWKRVACDGWC